MAFMGYETPVEMPSMGVYNTDLMKMYIAGVKDQYEKGQEEMKDFMKLYGDFYSDIPGATQAYNDLTLGGARDMINQMLANGIDPYKSPEARAAISRYIASRPTGLLNNMKLWAENAKEYKKNRDKLIMAGQYDPEFEKFMLDGKSLEEWDPNTPFTATTPHAKQDWATIAAPYLKEFEKTELLDSDRPGYIKEGVSDENQKKGIDAVMNAAGDTPWIQYKLLLAYDRTPLVDTTGAPLSNDQRRELAIQDVRRQVKNTAAQYYQPQYKDDWRAKADYENELAIKKYWRTTGANPTPPGLDTGMPSYSHSLYFLGVGALFGTDPITASLDMVKSNSEIGANIAKREEELLKSRRVKGGRHAYDFNGVIKDHTVYGDAESNMVLLGVLGLKPRSGIITTYLYSSGSSRKPIGDVTLSENQIVISDDFRKKMKSNYQLVYENAGYAAKRGGYERYGFALNKNNAKYATITEQVVTQLSKNGRIEQCVRVILHDENNKAIDSAYVPMQRSEKKKEGLSFGARKLYGSTQPTMLDVSTDWAGRVPRDAKATQGYMNKSQKDYDVYSEASKYDEDED